MNWISVYDQMPEKGDIIWVLLVYNRHTSTPRENAASCHVARVSSDELGVLYAKDQYTKDYYYFYKWDHAKFFDTAKVNQNKVVRGWMPFSPLPSRRRSTLIEDKNLIMKNSSYKDYLISIKNVFNANINNHYSSLVGKCEECHKEFNEYATNAGAIIPLFRSCCGNKDCTTYKGYHYQNREGLMQCLKKCKNR